MSHDTEQQIITDATNETAMNRRAAMGFLGKLGLGAAAMGLAAGINFSMRSVLVTGTTYKAGHFEHQVQPDELLQMYGRAGRRGSRA